MYEFTKIERIEPEVKLSKERITNFEEIYQPYTNTSASTQASRCIQCGIPYCSASGCPLNNNIPQWLKFIAEQDLQLAFDISNETSPFPEILGRICPHDRLCEGACTLNDGHGAVTIGAIEIHISEEGFAKGLKPSFSKKLNGKKVAIIGSGPAGLSCATFLLRAGIQPIMYERADEPGGLLIYGIPEFKLQKEAVQRRVQQLLEAGMILHLNTEVGKDIAFEDICKQHDAVFLATGATQGKVLNYEGYNSNNIFMATSFLTNIQKKLLAKPFDKKYNVIGKNVIVIGGGDTAMDCVRTCIRESAASVKCIYRRDEANMPGSKKEVKAAKEEGVTFIFNTTPKHFIANAQNEIMGMQFMRTQQNEPDATGRIAFTEVANSEHSIEADIIILALGFDAEQLQFLKDNNITINQYGNVIVNEDRQSSNEKIFAGGDIVRGADLAVNAALDGREAAYKIAEYVMNKTSM